MVNCKIFQLNLCKTAIVMIISFFLYELGTFKLFNVGVFIMWPQIVGCNKIFIIERFHPKGVPFYDHSLYVRSADGKTGILLF